MSDIDIQGHRGARGLLPENSLPAFQLALELGVRTLEMDTVISKDERVVVSHDPWFSSDICLQPDGSRIPEDNQDRFRLFDRTYDEIRSFDCGSIGNPRFPSQRPASVRKPLLEEVIHFAESYAFKIGREAPHYNIETKSTPEGDGVLHPDPETFARLLVRVLRKAGVVDRCIIQSFDPRTLRVVHEDEPSLRTALLVSAGQEGDLSAHVDTLGFTPTIYSPEKSLVTGQLVSICHADGIQVIPWMVNETAEMLKLHALGVDGLITDYPDRAMALVENDWH